jgi:uncharacterized protein YaeQ
MPLNRCPEQLRRARGRHGVMRLPNLILAKTPSAPRERTRMAFLAYLASWRENGTFRYSAPVDAPKQVSRTVAAGTARPKDRVGRHGVMRLPNLTLAKTPSAPREGIRTAFLAYLASWRENATFRYSAPVDAPKQVSRTVAAGTARPKDRVGRHGVMRLPNLILAKTPSAPRERTRMAFLAYLASWRENGTFRYSAPVDAPKQVSRTVAAGTWPARRHALAKPHPRQDAKRAKGEYLNGFLGALSVLARELARSP